MNNASRTGARSFAVLLAALGLFASVASAAETPLANGVAVTGISGAAGSERFYKIDVPAGQDTLEISTSGGTGDVDLYVRRGALPTTSSYDYRPYKPGTSETVTVENPAAGTWYIMLRGYAAYSGVTLKATYTGATAVKILTNGVAATGISGAAGVELYYSIEVPAGRTKLEIAMSGGTGDADLYVKHGSLPTATDYDYRPFLYGNDEAVNVSNPAAGTWYIMIRGYETYAGITLLASHGGSPDTVLEDGIPVPNISGTGGGEKLFRFDLPAGQTSLEIKMSGGTGDADLYVRRGAAPTTTEYDYRPFLAGNDETVTVSNPASGTWYVMIRGYTDFTGITLKATWGNVIMLEDEVPVNNISGSLGSEKFYRIDVPSGPDRLTIGTTGGTGNVDLYIRKGAKPTTSTYDHRVATSGNAESILIGGDGDLAGAWYIMLKATQAYTGVRLLADYYTMTPTETVITLTNGVPVSNISVGAGIEKHYKITVPAGQQKFEIVMSGGTGDADLYVRRGSKATTSEYDYRPYLSGNDESVTVDNPASGTWYIMIRGYQAASGITLLATYGGTPPDPVTILQNGVAVTGLKGTINSEKFFKIDVPAGQQKLEIEMSGGTGDAELYVRRGAKPSTSEYDHYPHLKGNEETVTIDSPPAGTYYIMIRGYLAFDGVTLKATYTPVAEQITTLQNGVALTGQSGGTGSEKFYKITVPAGQDMLTFEISGGTGDADMYVKKGAKPTLTSWDYRPYLIGNLEKVEIPTPAAATWYVMLRGYQAYSGVTIKATYSTKPSVGNNFTSDPNAVALWRFESGKLTTDTLGTNTLTNKGVTAQTTDFQEGAAAGDFEMDELDGMSIANASLSAKYPHKGGSGNKKISICFWMKFEPLLAATESRHMYAKWGTGGNSFLVKLYRQLGVTKLGTAIGFDNGQKWQAEYHDSPLSPGTWYHVSVTHDDSSQEYRIRIWDDTAQAVMGTDKVGRFGYKVSVNNSGLDIGPDFDGLLDEMVVFNDVLTTAETDKIRQGTYGKP